MELHNTATGRKEPFRPQDPERVTMYVCGPTVYSYAHIGNARPAVVFDVLARLLRQRYPKLIYVRNITDVDDKINAAAAVEGVDIRVITDRYAAAYHEDLAALGVDRPDFEPRVTAYIPQIVDMIQRLISSHHAYVAEGHVLFNVPSYGDYGSLSHRDVRDLIAGARIDVAPYKKDPADFVLWKPSGDNQPGWDSPWSRGRPGWHIECSAMAEALLGDTIDIHGGGNDLVFPHHENEHAQSVCVHGGTPFVRYWVHNGFLTVDRAKMSKSEGNVLLLHDILQDIPGEVVRLALLSAHYRQPLDWNDQLLADSRRRLNRLYGALRNVGTLDKIPVKPPAAFVSALEDDLNTPAALGVLFRLATALNKADSEADQVKLATQLRAAGHLLGFLEQSPEDWFGGSDKVAINVAEIEDLVKARSAAKRARNYDEADRLRELLRKRGIALEDSAHGTRWRTIG